MDLKVGKSIVPYLSQDEAVLGAFVAMRGPRPGSEVLIFPAAVVLSILLPGGFSSILTSGVLAGGGIALWSYRVRTYVTVVRTERRLLKIENGRRRRLRPGRDVTHLRTSSLKFVESAGLRVRKVEVGYEEFWVIGGDEDEARRLSKLPA